MDKTEATGDHLHNLEKRLKNCKMGEAEEWHESGLIFHTINELKYWQFGYASFKAYCAASPYSPSTAYNRVLVHKTFIEGELVKSVKDLYPLHVTKLVKIAPYVTEENKDEFLAQAEMLTMTDLTKWMIEKGYDTPKPASHEACVLIAWLVGGNWRGPAVDFYDDPGVARDDFAETVEMVARMDVIGTLEADIYHTGKKKLNYSYRDGHWSDVVQALET